MNFVFYFLGTVLFLLGFFDLVGMNPMSGLGHHDAKGFIEMALGVGLVGMVRITRRLDNK